MSGLGSNKSYYVALYTEQTFRLIDVSLHTYVYFIHVSIHTLNWVRAKGNISFFGCQTPYIIPCHSTWQFCDRSIISSFHIKQLPNYSENISKMYIFSFSIVHCTFGFSELSLLVDDISFTVHFVYLHYNEIFAEFCRIMINRNGHLYNVIQL